MAVITTSTISTPEIYGRCSRPAVRSVLDAIVAGVEPAEDAAPPGVRLRRSQKLRGQPRCEIRATGPIGSWRTRS